jgi:hypothetical protein
VTLFPVFSNTLRGKNGIDRVTLSYGQNEFDPHAYIVEGKCLVCKINLAYLTPWVWADLNISKSK